MTAGARGLPWEGAQRSDEDTIRVSMAAATVGAGRTDGLAFPGLWRQQADVQIDYQLGTQRRAKTPKQKSVRWERVNKRNGC